ncbi:MAG TPA: hypothetical protein VLZ75_02240 [Chitinophagales bacterium]|nr:hypothetical protein [Chitinophagales bacterium]
MIVEKMLEVNPYKLTYDGLYKLFFEYEGKEIGLYIYLAPDLLLKILVKEGIKELEEFEFYDLEFSKSTLLLKIYIEGDKLSFRTSEYDNYEMLFNLNLIHCEIKEEKQ